MKNLSKKQREQRDRAMMILWCLSKRNEAIDAYRKVNRDYCLCRAKWEDVLEAKRNANYYGVSDEELVEVDIEVMDSITDEEVYEAVYGE